MGYAAIVLIAAVAMGMFSRTGSGLLARRGVTAVMLLSLSVVLLAGCGADQKQTEENEKLVSQQAALKEANASLKQELLQLQEENDEAAIELQTAAAEQADRDDAMASLERKNKTLTETITSLESEKQKLTAVVTERDQTIEQMKSKAAETAAATTAAPKSAKTTTGGSTGGQASSQTAATPPSQGDCNIKGSNSGIYHVPGSTYYNRTTNVARWFCSSEEAEAAGYRAPKR